MKKEVIKDKTEVIKDKAQEKEDIKKINDGYLRFAILMFSLWYEEYYV